MIKLEKFDINGEAKGEIEVDFSVAADGIKSQMIKDYIVALRKNARQWSASTLGRSEVNHSNKKPHKQKGTGNARQGSLSSPQYKGGGIVFGPKPKFKQHIKINKKEKRKVMAFLFSELLKSENVRVLDSTEMNSPKTKTLAKFLKDRGCQKRVLFLGDSSLSQGKKRDKKVAMLNEKHKNFCKSLHNLPKVEFSLISNVNGYDLMLADDIVITEAGLNQFVERYKVVENKK